MIQKFEGVTVEAKANIYYDGKVQSRTIFPADGRRITLGVILPGDYEFGTADRELMELTGGTTQVMLPGSKEWQTFSAGESFGIPGNSKFKLKTADVLEYVCTYFKD